MNVSQVLDWVKGNVFTVIFAVVMLAALIGIPIVAIGMNESVREKAQERASNYAKLDKIKTQMTIVDPLPGGQNVSEEVIINSRLLERYEEVMRARKEDATRVHEMALDHNRKGRDIPGRFKPMFDLNVNDTIFREGRLPRTFIEEHLGDLYGNLQQELGFGAPPAGEEINEDLRRAREQFLAEVARRSVDDLDPDQMEMLRDRLSSVRLQKYAERAEQTSMYVDPGVLVPPTYDRETIYEPTQLFRWQWNYWIAEDVLRALADANANEPSVIQGPVKRVMNLHVYPLPDAPAQSAPPARGGNKNKNNAPAAAGGAGPNFDQIIAQPAPTDYAVSLTGRTTNSLYDVREVWLQLVVDAERLPEVIDAISAYNFMTVLDIEMAPADPFDEVAGGYTYGSGPIMKVEMRLETLWLREWMTPIMPRGIRDLLGIPTPPPPAPAQG